MKNTKRKRNTLLSFLLITALIFQVPLYAFAETEPGASTEGSISGENAADTGDGNASEEASHPDTAPSDEQETTDRESAEDAFDGTEQGTDEADAEDTEATLEAFATLDMNGALVTITSTLDQNKCLDVPRQSVEPAAPVILWSQGNTPNQRFKLVADNNGYYTIINIKSNLALDITRSNMSNGTKIIQFTPHTSDNQKWKLIPNSDGSYTFASKLNEDFCLDLSSTPITDDTDLIIYRKDNNRPSQRFKLNTLTPAMQDGVYTVQSALSGKVFDVSSASFDNSAPLISFTANNGLHQRFIFAYNSQTGYYTIRSANSNKALDVPDSSLENGSPVIQFNATSNFNQQWGIRLVGSGSNSTYYIYAAHSGKNLDLQGNGTNNSTPVITWSFHGGPSQQWKLSLTPLVDNGLKNTLTTSGLSMDVQRSSEADNANILVFTSSNNLNQKFLLKQIGGSASMVYILESALSGKLLSVGSTGNQVYQYTDQGGGSGNTYQQWVLEPAGNASFRLRNVATNKYLDYGTGANGIALQTAALGNFSSQAWKFTATDPLPDGLYVIASAIDNNLVFDIARQSVEPGIPLELWTANGGPHQTFKITKLGTDRYSVNNLNSGLTLDVQRSALNSSTGAGNILQWTPQNGDNQIWKIEYTKGGCFRFVSILQTGRACMTVDSSNPVYGASVGMLDINNSATQDFKLTPVGNISYYQINYTLNQFVNWQIGAGFDTLKYYIDPTNKSGYSFMQFVDVRIGSNVTGAQLNAFIDSTSSGRSGIFHNRGQAFVNAAKKYGINEVYFLAHAILESAWGTSNFARGNYYDGHRLTDGKTYPAGTYYNFWGIGAYDSNPNYAIDYAVMHGWNSPENAIDGSAKWIAENYIYGDYPQPTVYAMRWDYARTNALGGRGWHQYATSFTWASSIPRIMNDCYNYVGVTPKLYYVIPQFK
ncbi:MAG: RICIN domain-containing protein [Coriobacteriales bacterium]|jgi:beta-N-acetylglucosaminidase|nr:RICIN domain-containing protein [Coriobacteriales bacterium]